MTATHRLTSLTVLAVVFALTPNLTARQTAALKDLMPKGMVVGVALNQRQSDGVDTAADETVTKQFNQISPENLLKFRSRTCECRNQARVVLQYATTF